MVYQISNRVDLGLFMATSLLILLLIFRKLGMRDNYMENFENDSEKIGDTLVDEVVGNIVAKENDEIVEDKSELQNITHETVNGDDKIDVLRSRENDLLNSLVDIDEESDDNDEDDDEDDEEVFSKGNKRRKVGKTKTSSKTAYKAQKDLYNLYSTTKLLKDTLTKMSPALVNGQKIIEKMQSLGIMDKL